MSEEEKNKEEDIDVEEAVGFFKNMKNYFRQNPKGLTLLLHNISENLIDTINANDEFRRDIGFSAGQLEILVDILWNHDDKEVIQQALTSSTNLEQVMDIVAKLAFAYNKLTSSTEIILGEIDNIVRDSATALYKIIEYIIIDMDTDP